MGSSKSKAAPPRAARGSIRRAAISAEAIDPEKLASFEKKKYPKSEDVMEKLREAVTTNILFAHLENDELQDLLDAMFEVQVTAGDDVIVQGDVGDKFYVMNGGMVHVIIDGNQVAELKGQNSFGELALIYGTPRAATIKAVEDMTLYAMDGITYKCMVMGSVQKKRQLFEGVLAKVKILADLDTWERSQVADALESEYFEDGQEIIKQGDTGDKFYIITEGTCVVNQTNDAGESGEVAQLATADFFGEIALLTGDPRKATVVAKGAVKCGTLPRDRFERVLGPCEQILRRNMDNYKQFAKD